MSDPSLPNSYPGDRPWWVGGSIYQIYPRSFQDTNGDGIGDLQGITRRLDHLRWLGVDAVWLSPVYPSPMADFGYDISDHTDIDPIFGDLADMDELIREAHGAGLRVLLDFVPSHTSDRHPWFLESRSSRTSPRRDWYVWRDPGPDGGPPNNWLSRFDGESGWEWDEATGQFYLHSFLAEQPDLNWRNPEVRQAMLDVMRFWLDRGVDGFRVDVAYRVMKDPELADNPPNPDWRPGMDPALRLLERNNKNTSDAGEFNRWLRALVDEYGALLLGEINLPIDQLVRHYGEGDEFHLPQNIALHDTPWEADALLKLIRRYEELLPGHATPNWVLGNHDQHRVASRLGTERLPSAWMVLLTLRGTAILYYGDEIGMEDGLIPPDRVQDPWELQTPGLGLGRDPERTPMQWSAAANAGFCDEGVQPWLPVGPDHETRNVDAQRDDPSSVLHLVRRLLSLRASDPALRVGSIELIGAPPGILAFVRSHEGSRLLVAIDIDGYGGWVAAPGAIDEVVVSTSPTPTWEPGRARVGRYEGVVARLR